MMALH
jgi:hypothetical protein